MEIRRFSSTPTDLRRDRYFIFFFKNNLPSVFRTNIVAKMLHTAGIEIVQTNKLHYVL